MRIAVAMSGGVDSSVAAAMLVDQGHEVVGLTLKVWDRSRCCSQEDVDDARRVARHLGISFYVLNARSTFEEQVITPSVEAYGEGLTPNPCVLCNRRVKFGWLAERSRALGCERLATGHYARLQAGPTGVRLWRGVDRAKDQSYFLVPEDPRDLERVLFPLGELTKQEVRALAFEKGLPVAAKSDSQDLCFLPDGDLAGFLERRLGTAVPADVVDGEGRVLGRHNGGYGFTVGQRKGLGVSSDRPMYVLRADPARGRVVVGPRSALMSRGLRTARVVWLSPPSLEGPIACSVKIRSTAPGAPCLLESDERSGQVRFREPQFGVAPGQMAVFYSDDEVLGGAWIEEGLAFGPEAS